MRALNYYLFAILMIACFLRPAILISQGVVITEETGSSITPHESAILEVRSTEKGVLIPSLTSVQRQAISNPAPGLLVFDSDDNCFYFFDSSKESKGSWVKLSSGESISGSGEKGKVAYWQTASDLSSLTFMGLNEVNQYVEVTSKSGAGKDDPIFEVKNTDGKIVFGVYQSGVRIYVDDSVDPKGEKSGRGGFAVGGFTSQKDRTIMEYLRVTPDSVRIYIDNNDGKTGRGGFAVGGFTSQKGFQELFRVTPDSTRVYIDDTPVSGGKSGRGGFAVGGFTSQKSGLPSSFFNVETVPVEVINPSEARVIWDPLKNAFLAGQVLVESPLDVGQNSFSIGFENKAKGAQSQAMGYKSEAHGDFSTAIGKEALAQNMNSFAFGDRAQALNNDSYAFGVQAIASGAGSFAFGSMGRDSLGTVHTSMHTRAQGDFSVAIGMGARAISNGAFAIGTSVKAQSPYSVAMGYNTLADGFGGVAMGWGSATGGQLSFATGFYSTAFGEYSVAMGYLCRGQGNFSFAAGNQNIADGIGSVALGFKNIANSPFETVVGAYNQTYSPIDPNVWNPMDRLFVVGNGTELSRSNAMVVLKNGNTGLGTNNPGAYRLYVSGNAFATGIWQSSDLKFKKNVVGLSNTLEKIIKLNGVSFNWDAENFPEMNFDDGNQIGFIAQEVEMLFPELVKTNSDGSKAVSYSNMTVVLLEAIKELNAENQLLKERLEKIEKLLQDK